MIRFYGKFGYKEEKIGMSEVIRQETIAVNTEQVENRQKVQDTVQKNNMTLASLKSETKESGKLRENFRFFGSVTLLYSCFYAFCMYRNGSGITFPFFMVGSLLFLCCSLERLSITLRKGSGFYMTSMILLAVSTFCTDDTKIINLNKTAIFLLMMSLLLKQFYDTSDWHLGKYLRSILQLVVCSWGEMGRPFSDGAHYFKTEGKKNKTLWSVVLGVAIAVPMIATVVALLSGADVLFRGMTRELVEWINPGNLFSVVFRIAAMFFGTYMLIAFLCRRSIKTEVPDKRNGEPVLAITVTSLLSLIYILFSGIQIFGLFLGRMELPEGYTYAMYAREGFFQLLVVSVLNLVIVLCALAYFKESKVLKGILTIMSLCTFVMIASSAMRMILYIQSYYMTFLRLFVLWALVVLFVLFVGVIVSIFREKFKLFGYSVAVVSVMYLALSFSHPDLIIARVNVGNVGQESKSTDNTEHSAYSDFSYLSDLSADAAPILIPYMEKLGYDLSMYWEEDIWEALAEEKDYRSEETYSWKSTGFGYHYLNRLQGRLEDFSWRTYNISRHMALLQLEKYK